jgi:hypothetical protein
VTIIEDGRPVPAPAPDLANFDLDALIAQITNKNRHDELSTGPAVGEEIG